MKVFATSLDNNNNLNGYIKECQLSCLDIVHTVEESDIVFIYMRSRAELSFQQDIYDQIVALCKPVVILDYMEHGDWRWKTTEYQYINRVFGYQYDYDYKTIHKQLVDAIYGIRDRIVCYFLREMSAVYDYSKVPFPVYPLDFPLNSAEREPCTEDEFVNRPIDIFYNWGKSSNDRAVIHYTLYKYATDLGYFLAETKDQLEFFLKNGRKGIIVLFHRNSYERIDVSEYEKQSKLIIDVAGQGIKCFRNIESAINAASTKHICNTLFSYPWINGYNCVEIPTDYSNRLLVDDFIQYIEYNVQNYSILYNIYLSGLKNANKYTNKNYMNQYIISKIYEHINPPMSRHT